MHTRPCGGCMRTHKPEAGRLGRWGTRNPAVRRNEPTMGEVPTMLSSMTVSPSTTNRRLRSSGTCEKLAVSFSSCTCTKWHKCAQGITWLSTVCVLRPAVAPEKATTQQITRCTLERGADADSVYQV